MENGSTQEQFFKEYEKQKKRLEHQYADYERNRENQERRDNAWKERECISLYNKLIQFAGGTGVVRHGMRGRAKQLAINNYLKGTIPNYLEYKNDVETANELSSKRKTNI